MTRRVLQVVRISDPKVPPDDTLESIAFSPAKRLLAAGTRKGFVLFWLLGAEPGAPAAADDWHPLHHATARLDAPVSDLKWAPAGGLLYAGTDQHAYFLIEHELQRKVRDGVALVQESNQRVGFLHAVRRRDAAGAADVDLESEETRAFWAGERPRGVVTVTATIPIKGCDVTRTKLVVWSGKRAEVPAPAAPTPGGPLPVLTAAPVHSFQWVGRSLLPRVWRRPAGAAGRRGGGRAEVPAAASRRRLFGISAFSRRVLLVLSHCEHG